MTVPTTQRRARGGLRLAANNAPAEAETQENPLPVFGDLSPAAQLRVEQIVQGPFDRVLARWAARSGGEAAAA